MLLGNWLQTAARNFPMALFWQLFYAGPFVRFVFCKVCKFTEKRSKKVQRKGNNLLNGKLSIVILLKNCFHLKTIWEILPIAKSGSCINICTRKDQRRLMSFERATARSFIFFKIMVVPIMRKQYHLQIECKS